MNKIDWDVIIFICVLALTVFSTAFFAISGDMRFKENRRSLQAIVNVAAEARGVDPAIANALIQIESYWNPSLRGAAGEYGLGQLLCSTARVMGLTGSCNLLLDPVINADLSMKYLALQISKNPRNLCAGISGYNTGNPMTCTQYGRRVLHMAKKET